MVSIARARVSDSANPFCPTLFMLRLDWTSVNHLGLATIGTMEVPMSELVKKGTTFR